MIKANELRIGNYISERDNHRMYQVKTIGEHGVTVRYWSCGETERIDLNKLMPIPLTPDILEACGFAKQSTKTVTGFTQYCTSKTGMMLTVDDYENPFSNINVYYERRFGQYEPLGRRADLKLHQLQNLYYSLTGEELEIKSLVSLT